MKFSSELSNYPIELNRLEKKINFFNNLLNQAEKIARLGHWQWDIRSNELIWSHNMFHIYGIKRRNDRISFKKFISSIHPDDRERVRKIINTFIKEKEFTEFYHRIIRPDGEIRILHGRGTLVFDKDGNIIKMIGTGQDVTEYKRTEEELLNKTTELKMKNAELENFAFITSHDLQEPLRKLITFCSLLDSNYGAMFNEKGLNYIKKIMDSSLRMRQMISSLLELSSINNTSPFIKLNLNEIISEVKEDLEDSIKDVNAKINVGPLPFITGNKIQIKQVFQNLLSNALKFRNKLESPCIEIKSEIIENGQAESLNIPFEIQTRIINDFGYEHRCCIIIVKDNGVGFNELYADQIFVPFQTAHDRSEFAGYGMGLSIVKRIIETHKGKIYVKSQTGIGSQFIISLPFLKEN